MLGRPPASGKKLTTAPLIGLPFKVTEPLTGSSPSLPPQPEHEQVQITSNQANVTGRRRSRVRAFLESVSIDHLAIGFVPQVLVRPMIDIVLQEMRAAITISEMCSARMRRLETQSRIPRAILITSISAPRVDFLTTVVVNWNHCTHQTIGIVRVEPSSTYVLRAFRTHLAEEYSV